MESLLDASSRITHRNDSYGVVSPQTIRSRESADERKHWASLAFQTAALPRALPNVPGLCFKAAYHPTGVEAVVGGDWYDVFRLSERTIVFSIGDVMGHGINAAVTMMGVRQTIRGAAQISCAPVAILDAADRALHLEQPGHIVTAFVGVLDLLTMELTYAGAGHPWPLLRDRDGLITELSSHDLPLGLRCWNSGHVPNQSMIRLLPGTLLVLYTDGLTESTRDIIEGERRLHAAMADPGILKVDNAALTIKRLVLSRAVDDVAILTVRIDDSHST